MTEEEIYKKSLALFGGCAICGNYTVAMHHIRFGACGRHTYMGNVIPLCDYHHKAVHRNNRIWQPILIEMINERLKNEQ